MKIFAMFLTLAFALAAFAATAEEPPQQQKGPKLEEKMLAWALLEAEGVPQMMEQTLQSTLSTQMKESPELLPFRKAFESYLRQTISYEAQKEDLAGIYLTVYTPDDIRELIRFYQTPLGRKKAAAGAKIAVAAAEMTQKKMRDNMPQFMLQMQQGIQNMQEAPAVPAAPVIPRKENK